MSQQNKKPLDEEPSGASLIERAIKAFETGGMSRPAPGNPIDMAAGMARPADMLAPQTPAPAPQTPEVQAYAPAPVAQPAPAPAPAPAPQAPVAQPAPQAPVAQPAPVESAPAQAAPRAPKRRAHLDRGRLHRAGLIVPESGITGQMEEFRIVKRQLLVQADALRRQGGGAAAQRILVTSALTGEGKSYCAANLALSIAAEKDCDVLIVDFDSAKNQILNDFGMPNGPGLIEALGDPSIDVRDLVIATDLPGLSVLPGGRGTSSDNELVASSRAAEVLDKLTEGAPRRIVLFDSPPTLAASLPVELAKHVGQVVMVVRANETRQGAIEDAVQLLSGCPNLQLLLNGVQFSPSGRRYGTYYK